MRTQNEEILLGVGYRIRRARLAAGLTQPHLSRLCAISAPALSLIERGKRDVRITTLHRIADALRVPIAELIADDEAVPELSGDGYDLSEYR